MSTEKQTTSLDQKQSADLARRLAKDQKKNEHKRQSQRYPTFAVAQLTILDTTQEIAGVVTEISQSGIKFRPASLYLQEYNGERVTVIIDTVITTGTIRASRADGYGIQLLENFEQQGFTHILENYAAVKEAV